jgi:hypothetical protein
MLYNEYNLPIQGAYISDLDLSGSASNLFKQEIILEIEGVKIGQMNNQFPLFTEIHLRTPGTPVSIKTRYINSTTITTKTIILLPVNPIRDKPLLNYRRKAYDDIFQTSTYRSLSLQ